ncbi:unnamed protein product [Oikopleura dioica]|uniref:Probable methylthioribulose-1-phosphate dehydratase n=1 Tax=Oikopleura dioica TaxID=34765 RepID=E4Y021_OIKDI|nr:unnamed protein product [Oikopleura dioica]
MSKKLVDEQFDSDFPNEHPKNLIPELCRHFYNLGWATGTGGGISIRDDDDIYIAPSGVQKERIRPQDLFMTDMAGSKFEKPRDEKLKLSECTPLFMNAYNIRNAGAVMHSHSSKVVLASLIFGNEFRISHIEMIKGIKKGNTGVSYKYDEEIVIPIIENTLYEKDLEDSMAQAIRDYPESNAVIVRRHGIYVWGATWQQAKSQAECIDYLCETAVEMKKLGVPISGGSTEV